jgi:hypothetical protein
MLYLRQTAHSQSQASLSVANTSTPHSVVPYGHHTGLDLAQLATLKHMLLLILPHASSFKQASQVHQ